MSTTPLFPLYIPSKSRSDSMITSQALTTMGLPHFIIVEPQQVEDYEEAVRRFGVSATILTLDLAYKERYEKCDALGLSKSTGPGPARNFAWDHSVANGFEWHWVMDDNIRAFRRLNRNEKVKVSDGAIFRAMEDFCLRYKNVAMAGPNYSFFAKQKQKIPPFITNTRIYSCNLIRNGVPFRWRCRYNEDTILSLDMLKAGWCTIQFNAFVQDKTQTQAIGGGNTSEFYHVEGTVREGRSYADNGTLEKSKMQVRVHPDVSRLVWKFGRCHHHVDYTVFKRQKLILADGVEFRPGRNEYGMKIVPKQSAEPHAG